MELPTRRPRLELFDAAARVLAAPGPYLSIYAEPGRLLRLLDDAALDAELTDPQAIAVRDLVTDPTVGDPEAGLVAAVVAADGTEVVTTFDAGLDVEVAVIDTLPRLGPLLDAEQRIAHHVTAVVTDDVLELLVVPRHGEPTIERLAMADGDARIAALLTRVVEATNTNVLHLSAPAELLDHQVPRLRAALPPRVTLVPVDDAQSAADLAEAVVRSEADRASRRVVETMRLFRFHRAHHLAVEGVIDTIAALRDSAAALVLVHDDPTDPRHAWMGADPHDIGNDITDLPADAERIRRGRLVDVAIAAAIRSTTPVLMVPDLADERLADGLGVILAEDPSTRRSWLSLVDRA